MFLVVFHAIIDKAPTSQGLSFRARRQREPFHCLVALSLCQRKHYYLEQVISIALSYKT